MPTQVKQGKGTANHLMLLGSWFYSHFFYHNFLFSSHFVNKIHQRATPAGLLDPLVGPLALVFDSQAGFEYAKECENSKKREPRSTKQLLSGIDEPYHAIAVS